MNEKHKHLVATFGIQEFERQVLERVFRLSNARTHSYQLVAEGGALAADIALVDPEVQEGLADWQTALFERPDMITVRVIPDGQIEPNPSFSRPFLAKRVLTVLDEAIAEKTEQPPDISTKRAAAQYDAVQQPKPMETDAPSDSYRALVVDDSRMIRTQVGLALQDANIEVEFAESGEEALEIVDRESFDIIFLDVLMTGLNGYDVCKSIKRDKTRRHIPVVMLTSKSSPFDKIKGKFSGCDAYLTKPVRRDEFQKTVDQYLTTSVSDN